MDYCSWNFCAAALGYPQLEDITEMGNEAEDVAVEMAATGAVGQRLEKLDESFLMALDWMILQAEDDDKAVT